MPRDSDDPLSAGLVHLIRAFRADDALGRMRPGSEARRRRVDRHLHETAIEYGCDEDALRQAAIDALSSPDDGDRIMWGSDSVPVDPEGYRDWLLGEGGHCVEVKFLDPEKSRYAAIKPLLFHPRLPRKPGPSGPGGSGP